MTIALKHARMGKITPRLPARSDSKARFQILMPAVEALLLRHDPSEITIQMIAEEAHMPTATVYHFFPTVEAAMFAQAQIYIEHLESIATNDGPPDDRASWQNSWRVAAQRWRGLVNSNLAYLRLLLGADLPRDVQRLDSDFNVRLGRIIAARFERYFVMPDVEDMESICANAIEICDAFWRMSFERHATITEDLFDEGMRAVFAYMRTYLPEVLEPREA